MSTARTSRNNKYGRPCKQCHVGLATAGLGKIEKFLGLFTRRRESLNQFGAIRVPAVHVTCHRSHGSQQVATPTTRAILRLRRLLFWHSSWSACSRSGGGLMRLSCALDVAGNRQRQLLLWILHKWRHSKGLLLWIRRRRVGIAIRRRQCLLLRLPLLKLLPLHKLLFLPCQHLLRTHRRRWRSLLVRLRRW